MDDDMIDLMVGDAQLRRRLEAYADARLSPDLTASSRLRARVLAVAHRQADLARADAALTVLHGAERATGRSRREGLAAHTSRSSRGSHVRRRRVVAMLLAASLGLGLVTGTTLAARAGGPLYAARVWAETLTLPSEPSARALAELERLQERLHEANEASAAGDPIRAAAALGAYDAIVDQASAAAIRSGDPVAGAVLETGVGHNVKVLVALARDIPFAADAAASAAIERAIERAIEHSSNAIEAIDAAQPDSGGSNGPGGGNGGPEATPGPVAEPTPRPTKGPTAEPTPRPTKGPKPEPTPRSTGGPNPPDKPAGPDPTPRRSSEGG